MTTSIENEAHSQPFTIDPEIYHTLVDLDHQGKEAARKIRARTEKLVEPVFNVMPSVQLSVHRTTSEYYFEEVYQPDTNQIEQRGVRDGVIEDAYWNSSEQVVRVLDPKVETVRLLGHHAWIDHGERIASAIHNFKQTLKSS